jgi:hypothetical protein
MKIIKFAVYLFDSAIPDMGLTVEENGSESSGCRKMVLLQSRIAVFDFTEGR